MAQSNTTLYPVPIDIGKVPREGALSVQGKYDFSAGVQSYVTDLTAIKQLGKISCIQSVFIDNSVNTQPVVLSVSGTNQSISVPANFQGVFPVIVSGQAVFTIASAGNGVANIYFCNVQQAAFMWQAIAIPLNVGGTLAVADAILDATVSNNRVNVTSFDAVALMTDRSGTIAAGGVAQQLMAANAARRGWAIQNIDETILEEIRYSLTGAATLAAVGSFAIAASGGANFPGGYAQGVGTGAISIIAATIGHKFTAIEW